ncbi:MAG: DUF615 domain-containing protein [Aquabacterium sp.]|uniref:ribosome biogenesis factor YjgA n=1 Tax=Aquabacterium sp. G14 TaxID=3130164 RepID=UPI0011D987DD|nr:MAG: DUF615 domain-containing protein [Aquabacterium sp.]
MNSKHSHSYDGYDPEDDQDDRPPSKSMLKRASQELQALGQQLLDMPDSRLIEIDMPERLRDALADYKKTRSFEGKRRQLQFIGKVMREVDSEPLREAVAQYQLGHAHNALALHQAERWRAELIADDKDAVTRWVADFPDTDVQQLRTLIRNARKDASLDPEKRNGRAFRELFQFIKRAMESQDDEGGPAGQGDDA